MQARNHAFIQSSAAHFGNADHIPVVKRDVEIGSVQPASSATRWPGENFQGEGSIPAGICTVLVCRYHLYPLFARGLREKSDYQRKSGNYDEPGAQRSQAASPASRKIQISIPRLIHEFQGAIDLFTTWASKSHADGC